MARRRKRWQRWLSFAALYGMLLVLGILAMFGAVYIGKLLVH